MRAFHERRAFKTLLLADADVTRVLAPAELDRAFDLDEQLRHVDHVFERVFSSPDNVVSQPNAVGAGVTGPGGR